MLSNYWGGFIKIMARLKCTNFSITSSSFIWDKNTKQIAELGLFGLRSQYIPWIYPEYHNKYIRL